MKKAKKLAFALFCCIFMGQLASAQMTKIDSLQRIMFGKDVPPEERERAKVEFLRIKRERKEMIARTRPQRILLLESTVRLEVNTPQQDSLAKQLMQLILKDTLATDEEKSEAIRILARWRTPTAYAFLIDNFTLDIPAIGVDDNAFCRRATFQYLHSDAQGNWALFPEIMRLLAARPLDPFYDIVPLTVLLDTIVQDPYFLIALLDLYARKDENKIFAENKKNLVQVLQDMH